jgi:hypothetical protein
MGIKATNDAPGQGELLAVNGLRTTVHARKSPSFRQGNLDTVCAQGALMVCGGEGLGDGEGSYFGPAAQR